jgi:hypothetical protein
MQSEPIEVRAPQGAVGWTPTTGWLYDVRDLPDHVDAGHYVIVVSESDGMVRLNSIETAPLAAVLRLETDVAELRNRVEDEGLREQLVDIAEFAGARLSQTRDIVWSDRPADD